MSVDQSAKSEVALDGLYQVKRLPRCEAMPNVQNRGEEMESEEEQCHRPQRNRHPNPHNALWIRIFEFDGEHGEFVFTSKRPQYGQMATAGWVACRDAVIEDGYPHRILGAPDQMDLFNFVEVISRIN